MIHFTCRNCGKLVKVSGDFSGKTGRCPFCQNVVHIPDLEGSGGSAAGSSKPARPLPIDLDIVNLPSVDAGLKAPAIEFPSKDVPISTPSAQPIPSPASPAPAPPPVAGLDAFTPPPGRNIAGNLARLNEALSNQDSTGDVSAETRDAPPPQPPGMEPLTDEVHLGELSDKASDETDTMPAINPPKAQPQPQPQQAPSAPTLPPPWPTARTGWQGPPSRLSRPTTSKGAKKELLPTIVFVAISAMAILSVIVIIALVRR